MVARPAGPYPYYPVTGASLRASVEDMHRQAQRVAAVVDRVGQAFRPALTAVEGILDGHLQAQHYNSGRQGSQISAKAVFAAGTVQLFADGVDAFDSSVAAINNNVHAVKIRAGQPFESDIDMQSVTAAQMRVYQQAEADLDALALRVSQMLQRGPNETDISALWAAGDFPTSATLLWPELLEYADLQALPADLDQMTTPELARYLSDLAKDHPHLARLLGRNAPAAYALMFNKYGDFRLESDGNTFDSRRAMNLLPGVCAPGQGGILTGPDGLPYPVTIPQQPTGPAYTSGGPIPDMDSGGWHTGGTRAGDIQIGDDGGFKRGFAVFMAGGAAPDQPRHSVGSDQQQYLRFGQDGKVTLIDPDQDAPAEGSGPEIPGIDKPEDPRTGVPGSLQPAGRDSARATYNGAVHVANDVVRAVDNVATYDDNRSYAYQVVFQENAAGVRRAIIVLNQIQPDGDDVKVAQYYGVVKPDGTIGSPYEP